MKEGDGDRVILFLFIVSIMIPLPFDLSLKAPKRHIQPTQRWSCEKDPAKDAEIDLGELGKFHAECVDGTKKSIFIPFSEYIENGPSKIKKGDSISFVMPSSGAIILNLDFFYIHDPEAPDGKGYDFENKLEFLVDGEKYFFDYSKVIYSRTGNYIIPKGAEVKITALSYLPCSNMLESVLGIELEKTYPIKSVGERIESIFRNKWKCTDSVQYGHILSERTIVNLGKYGMFRPLCNPLTNRWFLSFSEGDADLGSGFGDGFLSYFWDGYGRALAFEMPADGAIVYNKEYISPYRPDGFTKKEKIGVRWVYRGEIVILYMEPYDLNDEYVYVDFMN